MKPFVGAGRVGLTALVIAAFGGLACATASRDERPPELAVGRSPPLQGSVQKPGPGGIGYFPLPPALAVDPKKVAIPPLEFEVIKPERVTLSNGIVVYLIEDHAVPLINLRALVAAGTVDDPAAKLGLADLTLELMESAGAGALAADALDDVIEFHAADVGGGAAEEHSSFGINMRSADLDALFPRFADMLLRPRFQADRLEVSRARYIEAVKRRPDSPEGLASRALRKAVHGPDSPFAREATERTLKAITAADLKAFHQRAITPGGTRLTVTGDFDRKTVLALIEKHFGGWKGPPPPAHVFPAPEPLKRRVILVPKEIAQAKIRIGGYGYARKSPKEYAIRVVNTALGSFGVGRMYREIRDERGLAYSAYASVSPGPTTGLFFAGADTRPESAAQTIEAALQILADLHGKKPITPKEISIASDMSLNSFAFRFDAPEKIVREKAMFDLYGFPEDYLETYRQKISEVDAGAALDAAQQLARLDELQIIVVGPPDKLGDLSRFGRVVTITDVEAFK